MSTLANNRLAKRQINLPTVLTLNKKGIFCFHYLVEGVIPCESACYHFLEAFLLINLL